MADPAVFRDIALSLGGAGLGMLPGLFRGWRSDRDKTVADQIALANEIAARGALEAKVSGLAEDLGGVAGVMRDFIKRSEKKSAALETYVTGQMPRVSGESERTDG